MLQKPLQNNASGSTTYTTVGSVLDGCAASTNSTIHTYCDEMSGHEAGSCHQEVCKLCCATMTIPRYGTALSMIRLNEFYFSLGVPESLIESSRKRCFQGCGLATDLPHYE
eukprot:GHVQ01036309.1.p2 GENE.GHVQ01036309.1~~GHVQ01036309.1.p2  ORF type:complete len:111 (-),score=8.06 GHVQ01036309.1:78-410(-)